MKLYYDLADWWHLFSPPEEYKEEAKIYLDIIHKYKRGGKTCLELGCGGGNNAFYLKNQFEMTLTDLSPKMLEVSKTINPECTHLRADMRSLDLPRSFDVVFIHDAISYLTTEDDLTKVFHTAHRHLNPGGLVFIMPDEYLETFRPQTNSGGSDDGTRGIRYLEWTYDPDPDDHLISVEYAYIIRDENGAIFHEYDRAVYGLFSMKTWETLLRQVGFTVHFERVEFSDQSGQKYFGIVGLKDK
ncbi:MAG: class I SAM-dependent methyltransferase [Cytophagales bacterium]|nr:class I SAM-dependent methyltransferase [Cytophagales bacterium]